MAPDRATLRLVFVEGKDGSRDAPDHQRGGLWAWGYWCLVAGTIVLLVLGFLA
jgi:hypothetical protein